MVWLLAPLAFQLLAVLASPLSQRATNCGTLAGASAADGKTYFGSAISSYYMSSTSFSAIQNAQFSQITPENEMKWEVIHPSANTYNWTGTDLLVAQAKKQGAKFRGHNFCWDTQTPSYVTSITDATTLKATLKSHIEAVMGRYADSMYAIDVVNEPLNEDGTWKSNVWYNVLGSDYIGLALDYAHAAAPNVKLYINDYNIEGVNSKSKSLLTIAKSLLAAGHPLHGIGFESHFIGGSVPTDLAASMKQFTDLGLEVAITELDVRIPIDSSGVATAANLAQQAKDYAYVTKACLANSLCPGVTLWGFGDAYSWVPGVFSGYGAACIYDKSLVAKSSYTSTLAALVAAAGSNCNGATTTTSSTTLTSSTSSAAATTSSSAGGCTVVKWGQCGGKSYTGCTTCASGSTCTYSNDWYSQCL